MTLIQHDFGSPSHSSQRRKEKSSKLEKKAKTVTADDMMQYKENPKDAIRKILELISLVKFQDTK